jgi:hypothetical protein
MTDVAIFLCIKLLSLKNEGLDFNPFFFLKRNLNERFIKNRQQNIMKKRLFFYFSVVLGIMTVIDDKWWSFRKCSQFWIWNFDTVDLLILKRELDFSNVIIMYGCGLSWTFLTVLMSKAIIKCHKWYLTVTKGHETAKKSWGLKVSTLNGCKRPSIITLKSYSDQGYNPQN